ncbi:hypothetical protein NDR87_36250 [Nocardia sp. CDC159]|uniref:Lipocalin-like domain-containing protein n=1 Tax=Nocardia pulmonis TaxID=2951408 RepID=A0A9X2EDI6_9NOCA|nr:MULTISPECIES: hypothetical protein [Nocardia]MCM6778917.1 hypothetical protein [Nocardia pulmonis]MCM6791830.1 hypothetical protein [Nocardia sp. CDC159]
MMKTLMLLTALALPAAAAAPAQAESIEYLPIGTWLGEVKTLGEDIPHEATFQFTEAGKVCLKFGSPGDASGSGTGTWQEAGHNRFTFELTHDVILPDGTLAAYVTVYHTADQSRGRFTSSGRTEVTDPNGNPVKSGQSSVKAKQTSTENPTTCQ